MLPLSSRQVFPVPSISHFTLHAFPCPQVTHWKCEQCFSNLGDLLKYRLRGVNRGILDSASLKWNPANKSALLTSSRVMPGYAATSLGTHCEHRWHVGKGKALQSDISLFRPDSTIFQLRDQG